VSLLLVGWAAAVAIVFTLTDWRQTKHLALLVPAVDVDRHHDGRREAAWRWAIRARSSVRCCGTWVVARIAGLRGDVR
jgi:hypothetical protein